MSKVSFVDEVIVYDGFAYFDDWLKANGYHSQSEIREDYLMNDQEDELDDELERLSDEFIEWCEENDLIPNDN